MHRGSRRPCDAPDGKALNRDLEDIEANYVDTGGDFLVDDVDGAIVAIGAPGRDGQTTAEAKRMRCIRTGGVNDVAEKCSVRSSRGHAELVSDGRSRHYGAVGCRTVVIRKQRLR